MNVKVKDLAITQVVTTVPHKSVGHAKDIMQTKKIHSLPVVGPEGEPLGIVTSKDLIQKKLSDETPVSRIMSTNIHTIPLYADVHIAARMMRNKKIHHLLVTDEKKLVGIISSFDLLELVEQHRFVLKNPPTPSKKTTRRQ
ncbi:MAG TPA: CBS domain-containing protein [Saprospiraceae bacterium]|nr:CBS domain-containing protein [Saprospiraceae bacterium]HMP23370.1 CBS domain-containing protein [Saprospiraceae bacterium]